MLGLIVLLVVLINLPPVQNYAAKQAVKIFSKKLDTKVSIKKLRVALLNRVILEEFYIEDRNADTLLYAGEATVRITDWFIFRGTTPVLKYVGLKNAYANLYRTSKSDEWNYQFVIDAFEKKDKDTTKQELDVDLKRLSIENVRFNMDDAWVGSDMNFNVGRFEIDADKIDIKNKAIDIDEIVAEQTQVIFRDYEGGRPPRPKPIAPKPIDTTAFNPDKWIIAINHINFEKCLFRLDTDHEKPLYREFDPSHILVSEINLDIENAAIIGDTLVAKLNKLSAKERSGLIVKQLKGQVKVSPNESIVADLLLETNNSSLKNYYAMHYERFPDFNDYVAKVRMVANFEDAEIDADDVGYFAPQIREYADIVKISGKVDGTVTDIEAENLYLTDGLNTIKGDLKMKGLPDIENTYITYRNGELFTSGRGIIKYAPQLKNDSTIALENLTHAYFKGDFEGYINNFALNGTLTSNLGNVVSDIKMNLPEGEGQTPIYIGTVKVNQFKLGTLLPKSEFGTVTLKADVKGSATSLNNADIEFNAVVDQFEYKGYNYQEINAEGKVANQTFDGNLIINDPNVSLAFYGKLDFGNEENIGIEAKANLIQSNLTALNLIKDDTVKLSADFDLDWKGNSFDDFVGTARLYNINLVRNNTRIDIDSVFAKSTKINDIERLTIESNAFAATVSGNYDLTKLHNSFQYYLAGYLPNYINKPSGEAPPQDITIELETRELDNLFKIFAPNVSGFSNTTLSGALNTNTQKLILNTEIPYGKINDIQFRNTSLVARGSFNNLSVNVETDTVVFTDSTTYGTFSVKTNLGNDKLDFTIETSSPNAFNTAKFSGNAVAHGDTLDVQFSPSEFYLHDYKWVIPGGNRIVYTDGYLSVRNLSLQSGLQKISFNSQNNGLNQKLSVKIENIDISEIGLLAGIGNLEPEGRISGDIVVQNMFTTPNVDADIKARGVKFGKDSIGNVIVAGVYDGKKHLVNLDSKTGIYNGNKSLTANGKISFDSTNTERIDGNISFNNAPIFWLAPILDDYVTDLSGVLDGNIKIQGTSTYPDIAGRVELNKIAMRIKFLGTKYIIPAGTITVNNKRIDLGQIKLFDEHGDVATLSGGISHNRFKKMVLGFRVRSDKFEVINLKRSESDLFYGNLIAKFSNMYVEGPIDDVEIRIDNAEPAAESHLYLPVGETSGEIGAYSYISFKTYGEEQKEEVIKKNNNKLSIHIDAILNPKATITLIMDPTTGDAINASGTGNISMDIPPDNDIRMYGNFTIMEGDYTFTLRQLFFKRKFALNTGSHIYFTGPIESTRLNVDGIYRTRARLYDLLTASQKRLLEDLSSREKEEAKRMRQVDVILSMKGDLGTPELSFEIDLPDKSAMGTIAYKKLEQVNQNERELFNQVASLLLINSFMSAEGGFEGGAQTGVVNNISDIFSGTASSQLTNLISRLTGDDDLAIDFKYQQYSYNNNISTNSAANRNQISLGIRKNLFNDRLSIEVGSSYDWGKPTSGGNRASNFNPAGDFRLQYLLKEGGNLRANIFRSNNYDVLVDRNISRGGVGLSWRKSFNNLQELLGNPDENRRKEVEEQLSAERGLTNTADSTRSTIDTKEEED